MATDLARLVVRLEAENSKLVQGLDKANREISRFRRDAESAVAGVGKAFKNLAAIGLSVGTFSVAAMSIKSIADQADNFSKLSQKVGVTVESLSALNYAARLSDASTQKLGDGLKRLSANAADTARGVGESRDAFRSLDIDVRNASGGLKSADQLLAEIADKFVGAEDDVNKTAIAMKIFGGSGADLIPLLNQGSEGLAVMRDEAQALGVVISDELAVASEQLNDNLTRLAAASQGALTQAFSGTIPVVAELSDMMVDFAKDTEAVRGAAEIANGGLKLLVNGGIILKSVFHELGTLIGGIAAAAVQLASGEFKIAANIIKDAYGDAVDIATNDLERMAKVWNATGQTAEKGAERIKRTGTVLRSFGQDTKAATKEVSEYEKRIGALVDSLDPTAKKTREYLQSVADLDRAWVEGRISGERYDELILALATDKEALKKQTEDLAKAEEEAAKKRAQEAKRAEELAMEPFKNALEGIQGAFTNAFEDIFSGGVNSFRDLAQTVKGIFVRLAAEVATLMVFRPSVVGGAAVLVGLTGSGSALAGTGGAGGFGFNPISSVSSFLGPAGSLLGIGALGGGAIAALTGGNTLGGSIGGSLGFYGGTLLGSGALGGVTGAAVGALGQLGNFVIPGLGLVLGALLGGSLGGKPSNKPAIGSVNLGSGSVFGLQTLPGKESAETIKARDALLDVVGKFSGALQQITGGRLSGAVTVDVGERDGTQVLGGPGRGRYANPEQALQAIIRGMLNGVQGVDAQFRQVFARLDTSNLEQAVQDLGIAATIIKRDYVAAEPLSEAAAAIKALNDAFAPLIDNARRLGLATQPILAEQQRQRRLLTSNFNEAIDAAILGITDPLAAALNAFDDIAAERLRNARDLGADLVDVERLNALERQQIVEQYGQQANSALLSANQSIEQFLSGLRSGSGSFLSPNARLANAESEFQALLSAAQGGDVTARSALTGAAGNLLDASRDVFGSSEMFFQRLGFVESTLSNLVGGSSSTTTFDNLGATIAAGNAENVYWNQQIVNRLDSLTAALADQQAALDRLAAS
ncbi:MAG: hypothetical protein ACLGH6_01645 [Gammaproteobacteria bacterium]